MENKNAKKYKKDLADIGFSGYTLGMENNTSPILLPESIPTTQDGIWINPLTGRELGATLDDLIEELKKGK